jgi:hypothetical protein
LLNLSNALRTLNLASVPSKSKNILIIITSNSLSFLHLNYTRLSVRCQYLLGSFCK